MDAVAANDPAINEVPALYTVLAAYPDFPEGGTWNQYVGARNEKEAKQKAVEKHINELVSHHDVDDLEAAHSMVDGSKIIECMPVAQLIDAFVHVLRGGRDGGRAWHAIIGRCSADEEDTCRVLFGTKQQVINTFRCEVLNANGYGYNPETYVQDEYEGTPQCVYVNHILRADTRITQS